MLIFSYLNVLNTCYNLVTRVVCLFVDLEKKILFLLSFVIKCGA